MAVHVGMKQVIYENSDDEDAPLVFRRSNTASKQRQLSSAPDKASSKNHGRPVGSPESVRRELNGSTSTSQRSNSADEDVPLVFRRSNTASKQRRLSSAPDKASSKNQGGPVGSPESVRRELNGSTSTSQRSKATVNSVSGFSRPDQSKHHSQHKAASNNMETTRQSRTSGEVENSDDSEDDKPLSLRRHPATMEVQKSNSVQTQQSPESKLNGKDTGRIFSGKSCRTENSDDPDDHKTLSSKLSTVNGDVQKNSSLHPTTVHESSTPTSSRSQKIKETDKYSDSEDEKPLSSRFHKKPGIGASIMKSTNSDKVKPLHAKLASSPVQKTQASMKKDPDDSDDDKPLVSRYRTEPSVGASTKHLSDSDEEKPLVSRLKRNESIKKDSGNELKSSKNLNKRPLGDGNCSIDSSVKKAKVSDAPIAVKVKNESSVKKEQKINDKDHISIAQRMKKSVTSDKISSTKKVMKVIKKTKKVMKNSKFSKSLKVPPGSGGGQKWTTLEHNGVIFPPPYKPHGIKMLYNGQPVDLTPEQEEVVTMFAVMKDTDYATKPKFIENFMNDWRQILGRNHVIKKFELCDFTPIYEWHQREKEKKKQMSTEEKKALKEEKLRQEEKYMWAVVDGVKEKVGNFRVEPPGLFRGRGEHPKMGKLKRRIHPKDITINIGKDAPIPECPIAGERWKEVKHDNTVTWLAFWNDPINPKEFKYVFLAASSSLKGQSDKEKYEKARLLKDYIRGIRATYTKDFTSKDAAKRQIAVATYLIDKLALRAGNEKDDDEADTVGCCTLKVENVVLVPPNKLQFDFLGKDSIRYFNTVEVELPVYKAIGEFRTAKKHNGEKKRDGDDLFDMLDTSKLNAHLKELMPGLTAKVFRTYNASITLDEMLNKETKNGTVAEKVAVYQTANKEVAIICNHQRSVSKSHDTQMSRLNEKIDELKSQKEELKVDLSRARKGKPPLKDSEGKAKRNLTPEALEKKLAQVDAKIEKMELDKRIKEDLKTVALGTSKINYLDPRITVAWCKRHEVPIEKIFNKSLLAKFSWAMDVDPSFRF